MNNIAESHKTAVGCSKIAQALGLSRWGTRYQLWMEHTGRAEPDQLDGQLRAELGVPLESVIKPHAEKRLDRSLRRDNREYRHPSIPLVAHLDYRAEKGPGDRVRPVVDMKSSLGFGAAHRFGEDGSDEVDDDVALQMHGYMLLTGAETAYVFALVPGPKLKMFVIQADPDLHEMIEQGIADYWSLVKTDTPPEPLNEEEARLRWMKPAKGKVIVAEDSSVELFKQLREINSNINELENRKQVIRDTLVPCLADSEIIFDRAGNKLATFKANKDGKRTDWEAMAREIGMYDFSEQQIQKIVDEYTTTTPGARVLRLAKQQEMF